MQYLQVFVVTMTVAYPWHAGTKHCEILRAQGQRLKKLDAHTLQRFVGQEASHEEFYPLRGTHGISGATCILAAGKGAPANPPRPHASLARKKSKRSP